MTRRVASGWAALLAAAVLAGCGGEPESGSSAPSTAPAPAERAGGDERPERPERPQPRVPRAERDRPVPILMYHLIADPPAGAPNPELYVSEADFAGQMRWLKDNGYEAVTMQQVHDLWTKGVPLPRKPVVLSFDDGFRSVHRAALPVLRRMRWPGVMFLQGNIFELRSEGGMNVEEVRDLVEAGWELDSHSITHPDLTTLGDAELRRELEGSRAQLRRQFGRPVRFLAYPAGSYDDRVVAATRAAGYAGAVTVEDGVADPGDGMLTLPRVRVNRSDGVQGLATKLAG